MGWWKEQYIYARHVCALFSGGRGAPVLTADRNREGDLSCWRTEDLDVLLEEGRRQLDRQYEDLERVRTRAQVAAAVGIALDGTAGGLQHIARTGPTAWLTVLWVLSMVVLSWSVLGAAATAVVRADLLTIHATVLSRYTSPVRRRLAGDYAGILPTNENQIATRLVNLRISVTALLIGGLMALGVWVWGTATEHAHHPAIQTAIHHHVSMAFFAWML